jgi:hypothetical protein
MYHFPRMLFPIATIAAFAISTTALAVPSTRHTIPITPHDFHSSSVGVLGCKINTDRDAYWPSAVSCDKICVRVSINGCCVNLLKFDTSGGAYDITYDPYSHLVTGESAKENPITGGSVSATDEDVDMSECKDPLLTKDKNLAFTAANSVSFVTKCKQANSWVGNNSSLFNIANSACILGVDERCEYLDLNSGNQPTCSHQLGLQILMEGLARDDILYSNGDDIKTMQ